MPKQKNKKKFKEADFIRSVWKTMENQAKNNPAISLLHERLESEHDPMTLVGLTGGIASGKSLVSSLFKKKKIPVIDADQIARTIVRPGQKAYQQIIATFGTGILDKKKLIDRKALGAVVFSDERRRKLLELITHPEISHLIQKEIQQYKKKKKRCVVVDAALLFESGLYQKMDWNILVRIDPEVQLKRLQKRDQLPKQEAWMRILSQMSSTKKAGLADYTIDNSGSRASTLKQLAEILKNIKIVRDVGPGRHHHRRHHGDRYRDPL